MNEADLTEPLAAMGFSDLAPALSQYLDLLSKWNATYNLTAIRDRKDIIAKHFLDSLSVLPWLQGKRILDVGSGAGFPGIPLALATPNREFVLLDSRGKKTRFLQMVVEELRLANVEVVQSRVESYHPMTGFDTVVCRAFSSIAQLLLLTQHLLQAKGRWLAMKGQYPELELASVTYPYEVVPYTVPGQDARCCVLIENTTKE